jgi:hypothetical protein
MVERKEDGPESLERSPAALTPKVGAVSVKSLADDVDGAPSVALVKGGFKGFDQARSMVLSDLQAVEDHVQRRMGWQLAGFTEVNDIIGGFQPGVSSNQQRLDKALLL